MKKLILISILTLTLNAADFTNDGATLTIGEGVTLRSDGSFENNGTLVNDGIFAISGVFSGNNTFSGTNLTYFGEAEVMSGFQYGDLAIEGANTLSNSVEANNLIISGDLNLSGHSVHVLNSFVRNGGDISGEGFLQATPIIESPALENVYGLGFIVSHLGTADINIMRYAGMVNNNDRLSINGYFHINLLLGEAFPDIPPTIGIALDEQDLNGMDIEKLSLFHSNDLVNWAMVGGEVNENSILLFDPADEFLSGYFTVGEVGCAAVSSYTGDVVNYSITAFGGENECSYDYNEPFEGGLSLMSFYSIDDDDPSINNVLSSLDQALNIIGEGEAAQLLPVVGWVGSLDILRRDKGYWLRLYSDDNYELTDAAPTHTDFLYNLNQGANLVSYSGPDPTDVAVAISSESSCNAILGQGIAAQLLPNGQWVGSLAELTPWSGYWLKCQSAEEFQYQGHGPNPREEQAPVISVPDELAFEQSVEQAFYFIEDIVDAQEGRDFVITKIGNQIVGSIAYSGAYTTVPVMGRYEDIPGYMPGSLVELQLYNSDTGRYYYLTGQNIPRWESLGIFTVGTMELEPVLPETFALHQAYPNPFNPATNIRFDISDRVKVSLEVYDINGRLVELLKSGIVDAGYHEITWNASQKASGMYFIKLVAGSYVSTQKIMLIK